jgi:hypothetical protein
MPSWHGGSSPEREPQPIAHDQNKALAMPSTMHWVRADMRAVPYSEEV